MWLDEQYIAQLQGMDCLSITIKGDWHRPRAFGRVQKQWTSRQAGKDLIDLVLRDNSPYKAKLTSRGEKSHYPSWWRGFRYIADKSQSMVLFFGLQQFRYGHFKYVGVSEAVSFAATLQFRSAVDRGMIRGLCTTAVQVFDITQWNLAEDSFRCQVANTRFNAQPFVIDR